MLTFFGIVTGVLVSIGIVATIVYVQQRGVQREREARRLALEPFFAPITPIGSVSAGELVKVVGQVHIVEEPLYGPLSGEPCAYYDVAVEDSLDTVFPTNPTDFVCAPDSWPTSPRPARASTWPCGRT